MAIARKTAIVFFLLIISTTLLVNTVSAQENITNETLGKEDVITPQDASFSESSQNSDTEKEILIESQRNFDRSLNILNIVATLMGVLVTLLAIIIAFGGALGLYEYRKWKAIRKEAEDEANRIRDIRNNAENDADVIRNEIEKLPHLPLTEKPPEELKKKYDDLASRLELIEMLGVLLEPEDYFNRGVDLYYKENYELALKAFEKAIELKPDYVEAWYGKGVALVNLGRYEKALQAYEKTIELKVDYAEVWSSKSAALINLGRYEKALQASEKAIDLKPDFAGAWYNRACVYSIKGDKEKALSDLKKAIDLDISFKEKAKEDEDFEELWDDDDFKKLVD